MHYLKTITARSHPLNPHKTVYTPGDNDWTDCDRFNLSALYDELERLNYLRQLFFHQDAHQLTRDIPGLIRQEGFIENALWKIDPVVFATLHIPGTNNGPMKPMSSILLVSSLMGMRSPAADQTMPNNRHPAMLTTNVPHGNTLPESLCTYPPSQYRAMVPAAPRIDR